MCPLITIPRTLFSAFFCSLILSLFILHHDATAIGLTCDQHPGYYRRVIPVLVHSWHFPYDNIYKAHYHPRYRHHRYAPISNPSDHRYNHLDLFWMTKARGKRPVYVRLFLHRPAKVYIVLQVMSALTSAAGKPTLEGWKGIGFVELVEGERNRVKYGVHQHEEWFIPGMGYVFERVFMDVVELPYANFVVENVDGLRVTGDYVVLLGEEDGSPSREPWPPRDVTQRIRPNERCPDQLHDLWVTPNDDDDDEDTKGMMWKTWHPQWDPCYWCAYDHEHGSSAKHLMGYAPKFGYTAFKNNREVEAHEGFKGFVFRVDDYFVYYSLHVQTSSLRRVRQSRHTIVVAVTHAKTKELVAELTHKGDFGFLAAQNPSNGFTPLSSTDEAIRDYQKSHGMPAKRRSINVIDVDNLDPRFSYRKPQSKALLGLYEEWSTTTLCSGQRKYSGSVTADIILSATGIKSAQEKDVSVNLGLWRNGKFTRSTGSARQLKFTRGGVVISDKSCAFEPAEMSGKMSESGIFYTDVYGERLVKGPGPNVVKQLIKPGLSIKLTGAYSPTDSWLGMHEQRQFGIMTNYGYGLDPDKN